MADIEDKLLGYRRENYASSSEEEDEDALPAQEFMGLGVGPRTGPKGVLEDYKRYQQLEREQKEQQEKDRIELIKKLSMTVKSANEEEEDQRLKDEEEAFLQEYHKKRLQQMKEEAEKNMLADRPRFGKVFALDGGAFLDAVDNENSQVVVVIHLYETVLHIEGGALNLFLNYLEDATSRRAGKQSIPSCIQMNKCMDCLAQQYPYVKFCKVKASEAGLSLKFISPLDHQVTVEDPLTMYTPYKLCAVLERNIFSISEKLNALPALQVYRNGFLVGNFIRLSDEFDDEFYAADVENFLIENDVLQATAYEQVSSSVKVTTNRTEDSDSDFDLD